VPKCQNIEKRLQPVDIIELFSFLFFRSVDQPYRFDRIVERKLAFVYIFGEMLCNINSLYHSTKMSQLFDKNVELSRVWLCAFPDFILY